MSTYEITSPSGEMFEVTAPDSASEQEVMAYAKAQFSSQPKQPDAPSAPDPMLDPTGTFSENLRSGIGKAFYDTGRGVQQLASKIPGLGGLDNQQSIDEAKQRDAALMHTGGGIAGNVLGNTAIMAATGRGLQALGGAGLALVQPQTAMQALTGGAALGALQPVASDESRLSNVALGGLSAGAGYGAAQGLSRVIAPQTDDAARYLLQRGVTPTPGQIVGPAASRVEQGMTSIPVLGDAIRAGQHRAVEQFNRAAANEALKPIGASVPKTVPAGHDMVRYVGDKLDNAYKALMPKLSVVSDSVFDAELNKITQMAGQLPEARANQLKSIIAEVVKKRIAPNGGMHGETIKEVESSLGALSRQYMGSPDPEHRIMANGITEVQAALRRMVQRQNPSSAKELGKINSGWARLTRLETAAGRLGSRDGIFSPEGLLSAVKQGDRTVRDRAFARGDALLQNLAEAGVKTLGRTVPDSGTPYRLMAAGGLAGLMGYVDPATVAGIAGGSALYGTDIGRKIAAGVLSSRPDVMMNLGKGIGALAPTAGLLGGATYPALQ